MTIALAHPTSLQSGSRGGVAELILVGQGT